MPVVTRSCAKEKRRPFIEQETPVTSTMVRSCRYETRSTAKRKIPQKDQDRENVGPSSKVRKTVFCSDFIYIISLCSLLYVVEVFVICFYRSVTPGSFSTIMCEALSLFIVTFTAIVHTL